MLKEEKQSLRRRKTIVRVSITGDAYINPEDLFSDKEDLRNLIAAIENSDRINNQLNKYGY